MSADRLPCLSFAFFFLDFNFIKQIKMLPWQNPPTCCILTYSQACFFEMLSNCTYWQDNWMLGLLLSNPHSHDIIQILLIQRSHIQLLLLTHSRKNFIVTAYEEIYIIKGNVITLQVSSNQCFITAQHLQEAYMTSTWVLNESIRISAIKMNTRCINKGLRKTKRCTNVCILIPAFK